MYFHVYINLLLSLIILYNTVYHYVYDSNKINSPFSDRVELPLYNIPSPFLPVMDTCSVDL